MESQEPKFNWKRLLITLGFVVLAAAVVGGTTWYVMDTNQKKDQEQFEKQIKELEEQKKLEKTEAETDETATWKTYSDHSQRFTLKYPTDWTYSEDVASGTDGIFNSNIFTNDNVLFYNADKSIIFGVNVGELFGRGGVCTKREVLYSSAVADKKLVLTKKGDSTKAVATDDYCGVGEALTGYQATVEQFTEGGSKYYIHSEMVSATDSTATQAISFFEKIFNTMTFK